MDVSQIKTGMHHLHTACEWVKCALSYSTQANVEIDSPYKGIHFYIYISQAPFEELHMDLFCGTMVTVGKAFQNIR